MKKRILLFLSLLLCFSCQDGMYAPGNEEGVLSGASGNTGEPPKALLTPPLRLDFDDFPRAIPVPEVSGNLPQYTMPMRRVTLLPNIRNRIWRIPLTAM
ncbi:MAG: hypothetical protein U5N26_02600 [Candidatus Marinimicrobia bacterium]|nr:hypothetical protein [Candidatus Neomarinimicrobiota bacterium]